MVMKKTISRRTVPAVRAKRLNVSDAKSKLSQTLHELENGPTIIHNRGRDVGVLISVEDYDRLVSAQGATEPSPSMESFLDAVARLKRKYGGGAVLPAARAALVPRA